MPPRPTRREVLKTLAAGGVLALSGLLSQAAGGVTRLGPRRRFSFDDLREQARALAARPYTAPVISDAALLDGIDFDTIQTIRFRPDQTLWSDTPGALGVQLFHPHRFAQKPVRVYLVDDGTAREVPFSTELFEYGTPGLARQLAHHGGFAGFRVMDPAPSDTDWLAFQGASYFRSSGPQGSTACRRGASPSTRPCRSPRSFPTSRRSTWSDRTASTSPYTRCWTGRA